MSALAIIGLALALAADAVAVAATRGMSVRAVSGRDALRVGLVFGGFQAAMPALGWLLGAAVGEAIEAIDHWVAFGILGVLGARMIWAALRHEPPSDDGLSWRVLLPLAVATSIDALAAGVTLPIMGAPPVATIVTIGVVTAALSGLALALGRRLGARFAGRVELVGGFILIAIGAKILVDHLTA